MVRNPPANAGDIRDGGLMFGSEKCPGERNGIHSRTHARRIPWTEVHDIVQETGIKTIPMEKKCKKVKWLPEEALQIAVKRREAKSKGKKERYTHLNAEFQIIARKIRKPSSAINAKK